MSSVQPKIDPVKAEFAAKERGYVEMSLQRLSKCSTLRPPVEVRLDGNQIFEVRFDGNQIFGSRILLS